MATGASTRELGRARHRRGKQADHTRLHGQNLYVAPDPTLSFALMGAELFGRLWRLRIVHRAHALHSVYQRCRPTPHVALCFSSEWTVEVANVQ